MSQGSGCYLTEKPNLGLTKSILLLASFTFFFDSSLGSTFAPFLLSRGQLVSVIRSDSDLKRILDSFPCRIDLESRLLVVEDMATEQTKLLKEGNLAVLICNPK